MSQIDNLHFFSQIVSFFVLFLIFYSIFYVKLFPIFYKVFRIRILERVRLFNKFQHNFRLMKFYLLNFILLMLNMLRTFMVFIGYTYIYPMLINKYKVLSLLR